MTPAQKKAHLDRFKATPRRNKPKRASKASTFGEPTVAETDAGVEVRRTNQHGITIAAQVEDSAAFLKGIAAKRTERRAVRRDKLIAAKAVELAADAQRAAAEAALIEQGVIK